MDAFARGFFSLFKPESVALTVLVISLVAAAGLALGSLKWRGIGLGIGGVLFAGLLGGRVLGPDKLNHEVMEFAREFGLILFVYTIGIQVGPGFVASLRRQGLPLNLMAAAIVLLGAVITIAICKVGGVPMENAVGLFAGATTNTPSLGAAGTALQEVKHVDPAGTVAAYAIAYPFGILGIILTMLLIRTVFRVNLNDEGAALALALDAERPPLRKMTLEVTNPNLDGQPVRRVQSINDSGSVISRVKHGDAVVIASLDTVLHTGDTVLAVGTPLELEELRLIVGRPSPFDLTELPSGLIAKRILVTRHPALGRTVDELNLAVRFNVVVTRVRRGEVELTPSPRVRLQFGDSLMAVGDENGINAAATEVGDSPKVLNHPQVVPVFVGIALGIILGSLPIKFPGMPAPVKLGLAGGPLIVAILLSRLGHFGRMVWYMPLSANFMLREVGIVLFLACVGVGSGGKFFSTLASGPGLMWMGYGAIITLVPLLVVGLFARKVLRTNYMTVCGLLAGSMTDPPALAFAGSVTNSDAPSIAYASVYPLVMLMRVLVAQLLVLVFV